MAVLSVQNTSLTGLNPSYSAASGGGDSFPYNPRVALHVKNASGGSINVTINSIKACDQGFDHDIVVAVPAGGERLIGPFSDRFADTSGQVNITYSAVTSLTVAALQVG